MDSRLSNHADLARIYSHTAELEIERKKYKKAREALIFARTQAEAAHREGDVILPDIVATSGWLAISMGKVHEGVTAYSTALGGMQTAVRREECHDRLVVSLIGQGRGIG